MLSKLAKHHIIKKTASSLGKISSKTCKMNIWFNKREVQDYHYNKDPIIIWILNKYEVRDFKTLTKGRGKEEL